MVKTLVLFALLTFPIYSTLGSILTKFYGTPKHLVRHGQQFNGGITNGPQNHFKYFQRNFGTAAKKDFHLWYDDSMVAHFDTIGGRVQIDMLETYLLNGESFPRYEVRYRDLSKKLKLSVLAIPELKVDAILPPNFGIFRPGLETRLMDEIISSRTPDGMENFENFDWVLIKHLIFNSIDCGMYRIKNRNRNENILDWNSIGEMIASTTMGKENWVEL
jgi:hypothetical protein